MSGIRKQSWHNPCQVTERLHALVQHTDNRDSIVPVIGLLAQRINHMHSRAVTPGGYFDVQRTQARRQIVMRPRARTIRLFGSHLDRSGDERGMSPALQRPELPAYLPQNARNIARGGFGQPIAHFSSASSSAQMSATDCFENRPCRA